MVREWDWLRVIACLSIVSLHTSTWIVLRRPFYGDSELLHFIRILLCYATPTFILLSIVIMANRYPNALPKYFWKKRVSFLILPFIAWSIVSAMIVEHLFQNDLLRETIVRNIFLGEYVGWFVLVIVQMYILYALILHFKWKEEVWLTLAILLFFIHHAVTQLPVLWIEENIALFRLSITGWLGYFAIAYLIGKHYERVAATLYRYRYWTFLALGLSVLYVYLHYVLGETEIHSRRLDLIPLVFSATAVILAWTQRLPHFTLIQVLSRYSFIIYLMHWEVLRMTSGIFIRQDWTLKLTWPLIVIWTVSFCIVVAKLISLLPFGEYVVGKVTRRQFHVLPKK